MTTVSTTPPIAPLLLMGALSLSGIALFALGCGEDISVPNQDARIEAVGQLAAPIEACGIKAGENNSDAQGEAPAAARLGRDGDALAIPYLIVDREADDQDIRVEICLWDGNAAGECGVAVAGPGGDGATSISTAPAGSCALHVFNWAVGCGRFVSVEGGSAPPKRTAVEPGQPLVARIAIIGSNETPSQSDPFTLSELGFDTLPHCD